MENIDVRILQTRYNTLIREVEQRGRGAGEPPRGDGLEKRVEALEKAIPDIRERLARVETKLDNAATKTDIADLKTLIAEGFGSQTKWFVATAIGLAVIAFTAARFIPGG